MVFSLLSEGMWAGTQVLSPGKERKKARTADSEIARVYKSAPHMFCQPQCFCVPWSRCFMAHQTFVEGHILAARTS